MCRNFVTASEKTLPQICEKMGSGKKCLIINTALTPTKISRSLDTFGAKGYKLPEGKNEAVQTLKELTSYPENCGKILCEIV